MPEPIYIVCGFPRSGTSMMMRALDAGGIPAAYSPSRDRDVRGVSTGIPGYDPNPHGFFELDDLHNVRDWPGLRGKAIKIIRDNLDLLPSGESLRAVYMRRDPREIALSFPGTMSTPCRAIDLRFLDGYEAKVAADVARLESLGAEATVLNYADVVADPHGQLAKLGWPFDVEKAAATVDPALYRWRAA